MTEKNIQKIFNVKPEPEKAIVCGVIPKGGNRKLSHEYLEELTSLVETAGAIVIDKFTQELPKPYSTTMFGSGKLIELKSYIDENLVTLVVFDDELSPKQIRNIENELKVKIMDRSGLILDIFAKRAKSLEAKTQVELAQMQYLLPRLTRMWTHLSKQFGGIGTKGPGETQIESDRRQIKTKIQFLKDKLLEIDKQREIQRKARQEMPRFALVGYTNAGKSTLMRTLTEADVYIEDKLFATLDTTVRQFDLPAGTKALLSDTVGFIRKLPPNLVASFRSTLAEAAEADVLVHVVDVSHPYFRDQIKVVEDTLATLEIADKPTILVFNKIDMVEELYTLTMLEDEFKDSLFVSASRGMNINFLLERFQEIYNRNSNTLKIMLPYSMMDMVSILYKFTEIITTNENDDGIEYFVRIQDDDFNYIKNRFEKFLVD